MENFNGPEGYPHWDESHSNTLRDTDQVHVDIDVYPNADGSELEVRRTVWKKAVRARDRHILWIGVVAIIPREQAAVFTRDIVSSLV